MPDLQDGESVEVQGSARLPYILKNVGGVYSCSCPSWRNQSLPIERRTCKHLIGLLGEKAETERIAERVSTPASTPDRPRHHHCRWPNRGTASRTSPDGSSAKKWTASGHVGWNSFRLAPR